MVWMRQVVGMVGMDGWMGSKGAVDWDLKPPRVTSAGGCHTIYCCLSDVK